MAINNLDVVRITVNTMYKTSDLFQNVFHVQYTGSSMSDVVWRNDMRNHIDAAWEILAGAQSNEINPVDIEFFNITQDVPWTPLPFVTYDGGDGTSETLPLQCCYLQSFGTAVPKSIGKKYLGTATDDGAVDGGQVASPQLATVLSMAAEFLDVIVNTSGTTRYGNWRDAAAVFIPWLVAGVDTLFRTQRRRVQGVGI